MSYSGQRIFGCIFLCENAGAGIKSRTRAYCQGQFKIVQHFNPQLRVFQKLQGRQKISTGLCCTDRHTDCDNQAEIVKKGNPCAKSAVIEVIAVLTLFQIFHQSFLGDTHALGGAGGPGSILQVNEVFISGGDNDIFSFIWCKFVSVNPF